MPGDTAAWLAVVSLSGAYLLWLAWPSLLPIGGGSDLTHHLILVGYLEQHGTLVHDLAASEPFLGEMRLYTPGTHLLAVLTGIWSGTDGVHTLHPLVAAMTALKAGFLYLVTRRLLREAPARTPLAMLAALLMFVPTAYVLGSFSHDSFLAQVVAEGFAVAMWWAAACWDERPSAAAATLFAVFGTGALLVWPVWIGPPVATFAVAALVRSNPGWRDRCWHAALAIVPIAVVFAYHTSGHAAGLGIARTTGAVIEPAVALFTPALLAVAVLGIAVAAPRREGRTLVLFTAMILLQSAALFALARTAGAGSPYMALKMFYLLPYPIAVGAANAIALAWRWVPPRMATATAVVLAITIAAALARPLAAVKHPALVVSEPLLEAGRWARANGAAACADYIVPTADTAYWLHLAVLGNPRMSDRTAALDAYSARTILGQWVEGRGQPFAIADLLLVPAELRERTEIVAQFGGAAVLKRPGADCR
jgi:hypothetical protein